MEIISLRRIRTPIGEMLAASTSKGICMLEYDNQKRIDQHFKNFSVNYTIEESSSNHQHLNQLEAELQSYFEKSLTVFTVPLDLIGTEFQQKVWSALLEIPFGTTRTYLEQSKVVGDLNAIRAVASANGQNRISIVIPCHRVIGSNGSLTGYAGKLWRKKYLLDLESNQQSLF